MHALMLRRRSCELQFLPLLMLMSACNALDAPGPKGSVQVIPVDTREAQLTSSPPVPISGGTLAVSEDGVWAVAADPDRDRVSIVALDTGSTQHIALTAGDEPGRVVIDGQRAFVALRRAGELAVIDMAEATLSERVPVCAAPRGMALDAAQGLLHVACLEGRLLSLRTSADAGFPFEVTRDVRVEVDLRDVMLHGDELWVSTYKRSELLRVDATGKVEGRVTPSAFLPGIESNTALVTTPGEPAQRFQLDPPSEQSGVPSDWMLPRLAYRSVMSPAGGMYILHQLESDAEVAIDRVAEEGPSPYGGTGGCDGIVTSAVTVITPTGQTQTLPAASGVLSVDMALAPDASRLAIVQAGSPDLDAPARETFFDTDGFGSSLPSVSPNSAVPLLSDFEDPTATGSTSITVLDVISPARGCHVGRKFTVPGQSTAVAFRPRALAPKTDTTWVVQSREPARLTLISLSAMAAPTGRVIDMGGPSVRDTGHDIFHRDAGGGIACASCHGEGGEDGHVWHFAKLGLRRTQALHVGLEGTAPFHWAGDESDIRHLMSDVFVGRMGGVHQSDARVSALSRWLFALQPPAAPVVDDASAVERGRALFMSPEVGCDRCHTGAKLTNNESVDVGTGEVLQVPSLRGIAYRAPFMHTGCARTLRDRFSAACGGAAHGDVSGLEAPAIDDLVAYLQTL
jgi:mono/diheme cytochrome c family protein